MKTGYTHLTLLIDRSASMGSMKEDAQKAINDMIAEQAASKDGEITISLYDFSNNYQNRMSFVPAKEAPHYELMPNGNTALIYSAVRVIDEVGAHLRNMPDAMRPEKVIFVIVTDGEENASHAFNSNYGGGYRNGEWNSSIPGTQYNQETLKGRIDEQTNKYGWEFVFPAAGVDAFATAAAYGIRSGIQTVPTAASYSKSLNLVSEGILGMRGGAVASMDSYFAAPTTVNADGSVTREENTSTTDTNVSTTTESTPDP